MRAGRTTVLVVEDDKGIRALLREVVVLHGHSAVEATTGEEALSLVRDAHPGVILLDISLPGMSGLDVLEVLKAAPDLADIPVVMVTAWDDTSLVARALRAGAHDYVRKPFDVTELGARIAGALRVKTRVDLLTAELDRRGGGDIAAA